MPLKIIRQDITKIMCDAIVDPTDKHYSHGGGTDAAIHEAAGEELYAACLAQGALAPGGAVITPAFRLPCRYVIHTVGPYWMGGACGEESLLRSCYRSVLQLSAEHRCESVAIPLISSGTFGFPKDRVLKIALDEVSAFLFEHEMLVYIVVYDKTSFEISEKLFFDVTSYIDDNCLTQARRAEFSLMPPKARDGYAVEAEPEERHICAALDKAQLDAMLRDMDKGFADTLFSYIDEKGMTDVECYKRANVDKKTFSKIKCNKDYRPSKITVLSFAIALRLDLSQTDRLLNTVGMSLSQSSRFDMIIKYFITTGNYKDIFDVNETLYQFDEATLGV